MSRGECITAGQMAKTPSLANAGVEAHGSPSFTPLERSFGGEAGVSYTNKANAMSMKKDAGKTHRDHRSSLLARASFPRAAMTPLVTASANARNTRIKEPSTK